MQPKQPNLLHIGLPRAASTYLQSLFAADTRAAYLHDELALLKASKHKWFYVRAAIKSKGFKKPIIFSHEGLGASKHTQHFLKTFPNTKVLLITRSPESWARSLYSHHTRKGGTLSFTEWAASKASEMEGALNVNKQHATLASIVGAEHICCLPFEWMRENPAAFFEALHAHTGHNYTAINHTANLAVKNSSLPADVVELVRQFSATLQTLLANQAESETPSARKQTQHFLSKHAAITRALFNAQGTGFDAKKTNALMNVLTKVLLQNNPENIAVLQSAAQAAGIQTNFTLPSTLTETFAANASILKTLPAYTPYAKAYNL